MCKCVTELKNVCVCERVAESKNMCMCERVAESKNECVCERVAESKIVCVWVCSRIEKCVCECVAELKNIDSWYWYTIKLIPHFYRGIRKQQFIYKCQVWNWTYIIDICAQIQMLLFYKKIYLKIKNKCIYTFFCILF